MVATPCPLPALTVADNADRPVIPARPTGAATLAPRDQQPLGQILLDDNAVDSGNLLKAIVMQQREKARLGDILLAQGWVSEPALMKALSRQWRTSVVDLTATPPDPRLIDSAGADLCLAQGFVPWRQVGGVTFLACAHPEQFDALRPRLSAFEPLRMLLTTESQVHAAILAQRQTRMIRNAELRVSQEYSCRTRHQGRSGRIALALMVAIAAGLWLVPVAVLSVLTAWAVLTLITATLLKVASFAATLRRDSVAHGIRLRIATGLEAAPEMTGPLPMISVMVPLFKEHDVAGKLVKRLSALRYPRELTDILLVVEDDDKITRDALAQVRLPRWMRVISVPDGPVRTKPRALNYALNFCRGSVIGVWDAEDRPEPDQLHKVARAFHFAAPDVACVQGMLDFYNPRFNWLARCFTVEYAAWYRAILPGVARLGLVVPLGGTTLFFRRDALEQLGAWDAWNVTEDADLGVRLARMGWRTELIDTVTHEEANSRPLAWVKQRSRWLKGYAMTWGVHMRQPLRLWRELGPRRFIGFQVQFLGGLSQYLLAPVLWSFWLLALGLPHPLRAPLATIWGGNAVPVLFTIFVASELISIAINLWVTRGPDHRHLRWWVPTLHFYFPLGCLAGWKAIYEVVAKPFYWDKTMHGAFDAADAAPRDHIADAFPDSVELPHLGQINTDQPRPAMPRPQDANLNWATQRHRPAVQEGQSDRHSA